MRIETTVNGRSLQLEVPPLKRLLDVLREDLGLRAAKEGCGEGECGACAVIIDGRLVNSCLVPAFQLHGRSVRTAESLGDSGNPDPVQAEFVRGGAVQCGFCTPGMVMAARALLDANPDPDRERIRVALSGNLCRCTGYEQIITAVERAAAGLRPPAPEPQPAEPAMQPLAVAEGDKVAVHTPDDLRGALDLLAEFGGDLKPVAGATDFCVETAAGAAPPPAVMDISRLSELRGIRMEEGTLVLGGGVTFAELAFDRGAGQAAPSLVAAATLVGAPAVRNRATLAGNIVTGSPCADSVPPLLTLDAEVVLAGAAGERRVPLADFYKGYRETVMRPDELLVAVRVPPRPAGAILSFRKAGARRAQSIAKASLAARARIDDRGALRDVRLAAGSVAPTAILLPRTASLLEGAPFAAADRPELMARAAESAADEVVPIDDVRSTAAYRRRVIGNLVARFLAELPV